MNKINVTFNEFPTLETERFILREVEEKDCEYIYNIYCDEEAVKYQAIRSMETMEQAKKSVNAFINGFKNKRFIRWCISKKEDDVVVGCVTLHSFDMCNSKAEMGYMLNKKYWRQNIMSEASQEVINFAFTTIELNRIEVSIHPDNIASIKLSEKLGFKEEGLRKEAAYNMATYKYEDRLILGLIRNDYKIND